MTFASEGFSLQGVLCQRYISARESAHFNETACTIPMAMLATSACISMARTARRMLPRSFSNVMEARGDGSVFFSEMIQLGQRLRPETVGKTAYLLFQFPEHRFYAESVAIQADDSLRIQIQPGADKDAVGRPHLYQNKPEGLVQLLSPQKVDAVKADILQFSVHFDPGRDKGTLHCFEQCRNLDAFALKAWSTFLAGDSWRWLTIGDTGFLGLRNHLHAERIPLVLFPQCHECWNR